MFVHVVNSHDAAELGAARSNIAAGTVAYRKSQRLQRSNATVSSRAPSHANDDFRSAAVESGANQFSNSVRGSAHCVAIGPQQEKASGIRKLDNRDTIQPPQTSGDLASSRPHDANRFNA